VFGNYLSMPHLPLSGNACGVQWNEDGFWESAFGDRNQKDLTMLAFQIIGGAFVLLFLAAAMSAIDGAKDR